MRAQTIGIWVGYPPHEPFFVKNLENVQGDERDVIFISIGYGRTVEGYLAMSFGPLNRTGGERRLNVLISRARRRCEVFTSLCADDIDLSQTGQMDAPAQTERPPDSEICRRSKPHERLALRRRPRYPQPLPNAVVHWGEPGFVVLRWRHYRDRIQIQTVCAVQIRAFARDLYKVRPPVVGYQTDEVDVAGGAGKPVHLRDDEATKTMELDGFGQRSVDRIQKGFPGLRGNLMTRHFVVAPP